MRIQSITCCLCLLLFSYLSSVAQPYTINTALTANDRTPSAFLGSAVALAGNYAFVGANGDNGSGAVYVYEKSGSAWTFKQKLVTDDLQAGDQLGYSLVADGTRLVVGAYSKNNNSGAIYVFSLVNNSWTQQSKLTTPTGTSGEGLGYSLAMKDDLLVAGAIYRNNSQGAAYVYQFNTGTQTYTQTQILVAADGAAFDGMGGAVATDGTRIVVGANNDDSNSGSAYVFELSGGSWIQQQKLVAATRTADDLFGQSVAILNNRIVVGAYGDNSYQGAAYAFTLSGSTWSQSQKIVPATRVDGEGMGASLVLIGNGLFIGSSSGAARTSVYFFTASGNTYTQQQKITGAADGDGFGQVIHAGPTDLIVGAPFVNSGNVFQSGTAYIYESPIALPVVFGDIRARLMKVALTIDWTTQSEMNNDRFEVQASANGIDFTTIATVSSKAPNGNADTPTKYQVLVKSPAGALGIMGLLGLLGIGWAPLKRRTLLAAGMACMLAAGIFHSCTKNTEAYPDASAGNIFIRIKQMDKDGKYTYSKMQQVTRG